MNNRPPALIVICVIGILWGLFGTCSSPFSLIAGITALTSGAFVDDSITGTLTRVWMVVGSALGGLFAFLLLAGSIGALMLKRWGRTLMMVYGAFGVLLGCAGMGMAVNGLLPTLTSGDTDMMVAGAGGLIGGLCGGACGLFVPFLVLAMMNIGSVKEAFASADADPYQV